MVIVTLICFSHFPDSFKYLFDVLKTGLYVMTDSSGGLDVKAGTQFSALLSLTFSFHLWIIGGSGDMSLNFILCQWFKLLNGQNPGPFEDISLAKGLLQEWRQICHFKSTHLYFCISVFWSCPVVDAYRDQKKEQTIWPFQPNSHYSWKYVPVNVLQVLKD